MTKAQGQTKKTKEQDQTPSQTPSSPPGGNKWITLAVRLEPDLAKRVRKLAHRAETTVSDWLRDAILAKTALSVVPGPGRVARPSKAVEKEMPHVVEKSPF